ncbi:putative bifunctional diguanylate cyclase/phosphodiesterase [Salibacterium aidingense]|uniref:putative bifunctional diguanylate cyclase/phosphodiesterase n=1 Tax=Salibacterium aidingense TaxID=384933 RepID=UPI003BCAAB96
MRRHVKYSFMRSSAFIITTGYLLIGILWILFSDLLVAVWTEEQAVSAAHTYKGLFFVGMTSLLLYITVNKFTKRERVQPKETQEADQLYKAVFDNTDDFVFIAPVPAKPEPLRFLKWNQSVHNRIGCPADGFTLVDLSSDRYKEEAGEQEIQIHENKHVTFDWEFSGRNGEVIPVEVQSTQASISGETMIIAGARDVSAYNEAVASIHQLSYFDRKTRLPNYDFFLRRLQQVPVTQPRSVITLNFNRFRRIHETMGAETTDEVLTGIAQKLKLVVSEEEDIARKTKDEFLLLVRKSEEEAGELIEKLRHIFQRPLKINHEELFLSFTAGIAWDGKGDTDPEVLVQQADIAFSHAKRKGWAYEVYRPGIEQEARMIYTIENDLHHALARQEMFLMYQPFVYGNEGATKGMEALLRWKHSSKGLISPSTFIPIAEENGLIHQLGRWVLHQVCREIGPVLQRHPDWTAAVNLSSQQLEDPQFVDELYEIVQAYEVAPSQLELEITERTTMQPDVMLPVLRRLKEFGFRLSLDDFGTGYSSLSQLKELPVDTLKIDRSFIDDMNDKDANLAIIKTIIDAAENLNMKVIAEGIEEEEQARELLALQCFYFQGYYYSIPKTMQEFTWGREA